MDVEDYSRLLLSLYYDNANSSKNIINQYQYNYLLNDIINDSEDDEDKEDYTALEQVYKSYNESRPSRLNNVTSKQVWPIQRERKQQGDTVYVSFDTLWMIRNYGDEENTSIISAQDQGNIKYLNYSNSGYAVVVDKCIFVYKCNQLIKVIELIYDIDHIESIEVLDQTSTNALPLLYVFAKQKKLMIFNLNTCDCIKSIDLPFHFNKVISFELDHQDDSVLFFCYFSSTCIFTVLHTTQFNYIQISNLNYFDNHIKGIMMLKAEQIGKQTPFLMVSQIGESQLLLFNHGKVSNSKGTIINETNLGVEIKKKCLELGEIENITRLNSNEYLVCFKHGWSTYKISDKGKLNNIISCPILHSFQDLIILNEKKSIFCIIMDNGSAIIVHEGNVRNINLPNSEIIGWYHENDSYHFVCLLNSVISTHPIIEGTDNRQQETAQICSFKDITLCRGTKNSYTRNGSKLFLDEKHETKINNNLIEILNIETSEVIFIFKAFQHCIKDLVIINKNHLLAIDVYNNFLVIQLKINVYDHKYKSDLQFHLELNCFQFKVNYHEVNNLLEINYNFGNKESLNGQYVMDLTTLSTVYDSKNSTLRFNNPGDKAKLIYDSEVNKDSFGKEIEMIDSSKLNLKDFKQINPILLNKHELRDWVCISPNEEMRIFCVTTKDNNLPMSLQFLLYSAAYNSQSQTNSSDANLSEQYTIRFLEFVSNTYHPFYFFDELTRSCISKNDKVSNTSYKLMTEIIPAMSPSQLIDVVSVWSRVLLDSKQVYKQNNNQKEITSDRIIQSCIVLSMIIFKAPDLINLELKTNVVSTIFNSIEDTNNSEDILIRNLNLLTHLLPDIKESKKFVNLLDLVLMVLKIDSNQYLQNKVSISCNSLLDELFSLDSEFLLLIISYIISWYPELNDSSNGTTQSIITIPNRSGTTSEIHYKPVRRRSSHSKLQFMFTNNIIEFKWKITLIEYLNYKLIDYSKQVSINWLFIIMNSLFDFFNNHHHNRHHHHHHHHNSHHQNRIQHDGYYDSLSELNLQKLESALDLTFNILRMKFSESLIIPNNLVINLSEQPAKTIAIGQDRAKQKSSVVFISFDRKEMPNIQHSGVLYSLSPNGTWLMYLLKEQDPSFASTDDQTAISHLHQDLGSLLYSFSPVFNHNMSALACLNLESFSIVVWNLSEVGSKRFSQNNIPSNSKNVDQFKVSIVKAFSREMKEINTTIDFEKLAHLCKSTGKPDLELTSFKPICVADILYKYCEVFKETGVLIKLEDVNISWLQNDRIALAIGDKVIFVYAIE